MWFVLVCDLLMLVHQGGLSVLIGAASAKQV
jgi:hypothetical protein